MPDFFYEKRVGKLHAGPIAGIDEAGRGPLAGPVVAAAVILDPANVPDGIDDSKKLSPAKREKLFMRINEVALAVGVGEASVAEIDAINILQATFLAMRRAVETLSPAPAFALIDGRDVPALPCPGEAIVKGDGKSLSIAAASIIAKVTRDRLMLRLALAHPGYGWERNKGYGTKAHMDAIRRLGPTPHHRRAFVHI
jgi:ribonuclease HII